MRAFSLPVISLLFVATLVSAAVVLPENGWAESQSMAAQSSSQDSSVANAARRNRENKKHPSTSSKSTKVITDDDLDRKAPQLAKDDLNVGATSQPEGESPTSEGASSGGAADGRPEQQQAAKDAAEQDAQLAKLKVEITEAEKGLDVAQRQLALDQDSYLSNPDHVHDLSGKAKLNNEKQDIADRQREIEQLKLRLAALEELKSQRKSE
jgi:hypothetical protein